MNAFVIHTTQFDESLRFYRDVLGLDLIEEWHDAGHGALLRLGADIDLELIELESAAGYGGVALGLEVADVDASYERLVAAGVRAKAAPIDAFGKRGFGTTDPNGVPVNIYTTER